MLPKSSYLNSDCAEDYELSTPAAAQMLATKWSSSPTKKLVICAIGRTHFTTLDTYMSFRA